MSPARPVPDVRLWPVRTCLAISAVLMIAGHWVVMRSGAIFDPRNNESYNVTTRWVSDFAARWPEGLWIKASIVFFVAALIGFFRLQLSNLPERASAGFTRFWILLLAALMIGGLGMVAFFDMLPPQLAEHKSSWWSRRFAGDYDHLRERQLSPSEWSAIWHHRLGFQLFLAGYYLTALWLAIREFRSKSATFPTTAFNLFLAAILTYWLFHVKETVAGVPQRGLLILIFYWIIRSLRTFSAESKKVVGEAMAAGAS